MKHLIRLARIDRRGNAMVEFALSFGLLFPVMAGVFQFGYSYYIYNLLETSVRSTARYAATRTYDSPNTTPSSNYLTGVKNMLVYGDPAGSGSAIVPGLTTAHVRVRVNFDSGIPDNVTVDVAGYTIDSVLGRITLNGKPAATFPYLGRWDP